MTDKVFIGIDPGQNGALAFLFGTSDTPHYFDMPLLPNGEIDARGVRKLFQDLHEPFCIIEHAQVMPGQGAVSGFNYGCGYGTLKAVLSLMRIPFEEIRPQKWKKEFSLIKAKDKSIPKTTQKKIAKEESITKVLELFPLMSKEDFYTARGRMLDGRAESILIAEYGRRTLMRGMNNDLRGNGEKV